MVFKKNLNLDPAMGMLLDNIHSKRWGIACGSHHWYYQLEQACEGVGRTVVAQTLQGFVPCWSLLYIMLQNK